MTDSRRADLERNIAASRKQQARARRLTFIAIAIAAVIAWFYPSVGMVAIVLVVSISFVTFWITAAHIADFDEQLERLERLGRVR